MFVVRPRMSHSLYIYGVKSGQRTSRIVWLTGVDKPHRARPIFACASDTSRAYIRALSLSHQNRGGVRGWLHHYGFGGVVDVPCGVRVADEVRLRAMELIADGRSASAAARELGVSHTTVQRWARGAGVGLAMGAVGARRPGGRPAQAGGVRGLGRAGAGRAGAGRAGGVSIPAAGRWLHDTRMQCPRPPRCRRRAPGMAVRSGVAGGAGAPCGHRITGDPTRGCRGGAGRGLRLGAGERAMIATGLAQGDSAALIARRIGRCRPTVSREIRRGAGVGRGLPPRGGTGRGPGAVGPPQDPQTGRQSGPARAGRRPARGIGAGPRADRRPPAVREPR